MTALLHGKTCAILLFEEPDGAIESLSLVQGVLRAVDSSGDGNPAAVWLLPDAGGDPVPVPPHLAAAIRPTPPELRESLTDVVSAMWLAAYFDGRLDPRSIDLAAVLARCTGPVDPD